MADGSITPKMIKELRDRTGVGMGKCKEALENAKGDSELAIANLRKSGIATAIKKEGRATNEGVIVSAEGREAVAVVEINAETDFVIKNDLFQKFIKAIAEEVITHQSQSVEALLAQPYSQDQSLTIDQYRATVMQSIGENIQVRRLKVISKNANQSVGVYSHLGGKILTLVEITGSANEEELARDIAMHIAAASPDFLDPTHVPAETVAQEKEIARSQMAGKPANIVDKIIEGKMNAFYEANCLLKQKYIKNDSFSIEELVNQRAKEVGKELKVTDFLRWNVGQS